MRNRSRTLSVPSLFPKMVFTPLLSALILLCLAPSSAGALPGDYTIELGLGNSIYQSEIWQYVPDAYTRSRDGGGLGLRFRQAVEMYPGISLGLAVDYLQIEDRTVRIGVFDVPLTTQAIPVLVSYRQYSGQLYMQAEVGFAGWNGDKGGFEFAGSFGGGYTMALSDWLNFTLSTRILIILSDKVIMPVVIGTGVEMVL
mgnify:CR=1 FL=1